MYLRTCTHVVQYMQKKKAGAAQPLRPSLSLCYCSIFFRDSLPDLLGLEVQYVVVGDWDRPPRVGGGSREGKKGKERVNKARMGTVTNAQSKNEKKQQKQEILLVPLPLLLPSPLPLCQNSALAP